MARLMIEVHSRSNIRFPTSKSFEAPLNFSDIVVFMASERDIYLGQKFITIKTCELN